MKTLFILRHAKSSWESAELSDFERPLNERGLEEAASIGEIIFEMRFQPEIIISSPAERASQTTILVKEKARLKAEIKYDERIYEASPHRLIEIVSQLDDDSKTAIIVGHNPGLENLIRILTGSIHSMQTASLAVIDLDGEKWSDVTGGGSSGSGAGGKLRALIRPKDNVRFFGERAAV